MAKAPPKSLPREFQLLPRRSAVGKNRTRRGRLWSLTQKRRQWASSQPPPKLSSQQVSKHRTKRPAVDAGPVPGVTGTARAKVGSIAAQAAVVDARPVAGLTAAGSDRSGSALRCAVAFGGTPNVPHKAAKPAAGGIMLTAPMAFVGSVTVTRTALGHIWSGWTSIRNKPIGLRPAAAGITMTAPPAIAGSSTATRTAPGHLGSGLTSTRDKVVPSSLCVSLATVAARCCSARRSPLSVASATAGAPRGKEVTAFLAGDEGRRWRSRAATLCWGGGTRAEPGAHWGVRGGGRDKPALPTPPPTTSPRAATSRGHFPLATDRRMHDDCRTASTPPPRPPHVRIGLCIRASDQGEIGWRLSTQAALEGWRARGSVRARKRHGKPSTTHQAIARLAVLRLAGGVPHSRRPRRGGAQRRRPHGRRRGGERRTGGGAAAGGADKAI